MKLLRFLLHFFFPARCIFCDAVLPYSIDSKLCAPCKEGIALAGEHTCSVCGVPIGENYAYHLCGACRKKKRYFNQNISLYRYQKSVRNGVHLMKFTEEGCINAAEYGKMMAELVQREYGNISFDYVIPVPISRARRHMRGYNQSEAMAGEVSYCLQIPLETRAIKKCRNNPKQSGLRLRDREKNVKGVYRVTKPQLLEDKTILLIDDVFTSGATLNEVSRVLKQAGAVTVFCATFSIVTMQ